MYRYFVSLLVLTALTLVLVTGCTDRGANSSERRTSGGQVWATMMSPGKTDAARLASCKDSRLKKTSAAAAARPSLVDTQAPLGRASRRAILPLICETSC